MLNCDAEDQTEMQTGALPFICFLLPCRLITLTVLHVQSPLLPLRGYGAKQHGRIV